MFSHINLDQFVTLGHPMRKFRPLIDMDRIRAFCEPLYSDADPPSIQLEKLFLALRDGSLFWSTQNVPWLRELTGKLVLLRFVGLDLATAPWDHSTFMQNRTQRIAESGLLEQLCDETVALAIKQKLVSAHTMLDGTL